jgi:hypothetical protein
VLRPDGSLAVAGGYDVATGYLIGSPATMQLTPPPERPTGGDVRRARGLLLEELLGEFDFTGEADRAHALSALLWPFGRTLFPQARNSPLHLISKPTQGSGGSLLARAIALPAFGSDIGLLAEAESDAEWRKRITALALQGHGLVLIDNLREVLDSPALASILTSPRWKDRLLGTNSIAELEFAPVWLATGNNPTLSAEMSRRAVQIRIDPRVDRPWQRSGWRHPQLLEWATENRGDLVWAALVLWRHWIASGRRAFTGELLGSYEDWSRVMGGLLEAAEVPGFLENLPELYEASDSATSGLRSLLYEWYECFGTRPVMTRGLLNDVVEDPNREVAIQFQGRDEAARTMELGKLLGGMRERRFTLELDGELSVVYVSRATMQSGHGRWRLVVD